MLKILSSEYYVYACGKIFRTPRSLPEVVYLISNENPDFSKHPEGCKKRKSGTAALGKPVNLG
jgi:hypothetical protein